MKNQRKMKGWLEGWMKTVRLMRDLRRQRSLMNLRQHPMQAVEGQH